LIMGFILEGKNYMTVEIFFIAIIFRMPLNAIISLKGITISRLLTRVLVPLKSGSIAALRSQPRPSRFMAKIGSSVQNASDVPLGRKEFSS